MNRPSRHPARFVTVAHRRARIGAALATALVVCLTLASVVLEASAHSARTNAPTLLVAVTFVALAGGMAGMGLIIALLKPRHPIGWLMLGSANLITISNLGGAYADLSVAAHAGSLPATGLAAWVSSWAFVPNLGILGIIIPLIYPTGRFLTRRWSMLGIVLVALGTASAVAGALAPGPLSSEPSITNPFGLPAAGPVLDVVGFVGTVSAPVGFVAALVSLVLRFRRGSRVERQQLKLFAYPMAIAAIALTVSIPNNGPISDVGWEVGIAALAAVPVAIAVAIVRHGLFDIDRLIKRTLVYGVLSALLAALYAVLVLAAQPLVATLTGGTALTVAAATLVVAALFQPLRRRVQVTVDRRFDRSTYDAQLLVAAFAGRLRDRVDLDEVTVELTMTAEQALRPAGASVWLRDRMPRR